MNTPIPAQPASCCEGRWGTYLKAALFVLPALLGSVFAAIFMFPKLQQIIRDAGVNSPDMNLFLAAAAFLFGHGGALLLGLFVFLAGLELLARKSACYRRVGLSAMVFLFNAAVIVGLTGMCISLLLVAPALMHSR